MPLYRLKLVLRGISPQIWWRLPRWRRLQRCDPNQVRLSQFRLRPGERFLYEYDCTDRWRLDVRLEAILPAEPQQVYPVCTAGKYACPPEECGGVEDYLAYRCLL